MKSWTPTLGQTNNINKDWQNNQPMVKIQDNDEACKQPGSGLARIASPKTDCQKQPGSRLARIASPKTDCQKQPGSRLARIASPKTDCQKQPGSRLARIASPKTNCQKQPGSRLARIDWRGSPARRPTAKHEQTCRTPDWRDHQPRCPAGKARDNLACWPPADRGPEGPLPTGWPNRQPQP